MEQPIEVSWSNDTQGNIIYAICVCEVTGRADVAVYGKPGEGVISRSPEFADIDEATDWAHERAPSVRSLELGEEAEADIDLQLGSVATTDIELSDESPPYNPDGSETKPKLRTQCCRAYDTYWDNVHICRACHRPNPIMVLIK